MINQKSIDLFKSHLEEKSSGCLEWTGSTTRDGYGKVKIKQKVYGAHRIAFLIHNRCLPKDKEIMHKCDNKLCCNPEHLVAGTHKDNMQDMIKKGRQGKVKNKIIKLTIEKVTEIRRLSDEGLSKHKIASRFNISCHHVRDIVNNVYWKDKPTQQQKRGECQQKETR